MPASLDEIIRNKISNEGPITFEEFMEMALYYPQLGYYTSSSEKIGEKGDYYTAPYLTNIFANMLATQLEEMWVVMGKQNFTIVEYGAGPGSLCRDILRQLKQNDELYKNLKYCIIEKSEAMRQKENIVLNEFTNGKVYWYNSIDEIKSFTGCIIANELIDNFSVHKVVMTEKGLMEIFVNYENSFVEVLKPAANNLIEYFEQLNVQLAIGYQAEINLQALDWIKEISRSLNKGFVVTIDYGFPSSELYQSNRRMGTMLCYFKHTVNDLPYYKIGEQDITTHVNFSALDRWGIKNGLHKCGFTDQAQFLISLGLTEHLRQIEMKEKDNYMLRRKLVQVYSQLMSMGRKFKVLIQQKGLQQPSLSGLKFSQPLV